VDFQYKNDDGTLAAREQSFCHGPVDLSLSVQSLSCVDCVIKRNLASSPWQGNRKQKPVQSSVRKDHRYVVASSCCCQSSSTCLEIDAALTKRVLRFVLPQNRLCLPDGQIKNSHFQNINSTQLLSSTATRFVGGLGFASSHCLLPIHRSWRLFVSSRSGLRAAWLPCE